MPDSSILRWPKRSATKPQIIPVATPTAASAEMIHPASTRVRPSSARKLGSAAGSLPIWNAATMPATAIIATASHEVVGARQSVAVIRAGGSGAEDRLGQAAHAGVRREQRAGERLFRRAPRGPCGARRW